MKPANIPAVAKLLFPLIVGIVFRYYFGFSIGFASLFIVCGLTIFIGLLQPRNISTKLIFESLLFILFFSFGLYLENKSNSTKYSNYFTSLHQKDSLNSYQLRIVEPPTVKDKWVKCKVDVVAVNNKSSEGFRKRLSIN